MLSVVIPAFNEEANIARCLDSLVCQKTNEPFEVIVVDNNSIDNTTKIVNQYKDKLDLKLIKEPKKGRGAARYAGFKKAQGEIILSTDADSVVPNDWIMKMVELLRGGNDVAVTGINKIFDSLPVNNFFYNFLHPVSFKIYKIIMGHYFLCGFNFAIYKTVYEKAGGFNHKLNAQEDSDLATRVCKLGKIGYAKGIVVVSSGRRFKNGLIRGLISYPITVFKCVILKQNTIILSDER